VQPYRLAVGDFDGDGDPDVAVANFIYGIVSILGNPGDGLVTLSAEYQMPHQTLHIRALDLDLDGDQDLMLGGVFMWNTEGTFEVEEFGVQDEFAIAVPDCDGDGLADGLFLTTTSEMFVRKNLGGWVMGPAESHELTGRIRGAVHGDLNGDGDDDVVLTTGPWTGGQGGAVTILINHRSCPSDLNQTGSVDISDMLMLLANWDGQGTAGDLDGDGVVGVNDILILLASWGDCP
jgi:hypothetical protein